jgi:hypothetical protein
LDAIVDKLPQAFLKKVNADDNAGAVSEVMGKYEEDSSYKTVIEKLRQKMN